MHDEMNNMKRIAKTACVFISLLFISCSGDDEALASVQLVGIYFETFPSNNYQIEFQNNEIMILKEIGRSSSDQQFFYQISGDVIELTPTVTSRSRLTLQIKIIDDTEFQLTNIFYPSVGEDTNPILFVTFEK